MWKTRRACGANWEQLNQLRYAVLGEQQLTQLVADRDLERLYQPQRDARTAGCRDGGVIAGDLIAALMASSLE